MADLRLAHLTYAGSAKPLAQVVFGPELTVIYGASDTGKSFIVDSIEYMLGGTDLTLVPEAEGYSQILLGLHMPDGSPLTLVRRPGSNAVQAHYADLRSLVTRPADRQLTAVHRARSTRSVSAFLLGRCSRPGSSLSAAPSPTRSFCPFAAAPFPPPRPSPGPQGAPGRQPCPPRGDARGQRSSPR